jgi:hypothetical protein
VVSNYGDPPIDESLAYMNPIGYIQQRKRGFKVSNPKEILNKINNYILTK